MLIATHFLSRYVLPLYIATVCFWWGCAPYPYIPEMKTQKGFEKTGVSLAKENEVLQRSLADFSHLKEKNNDYIVRPEDVLRIMVWDHDDLTREVQISQEGEFNFPLIGKVDTHGATISELEKKLADELSGRFIINPQLTIDVKEKPGECFFVYGEVKMPGRYELLKGTTILKAITTAGGVTEKAALKKTKVVREHGEKKTKIAVEMTDMVEAQDIIMVPESFF